MYRSVIVTFMPSLKTEIKLDLHVGWRSGCLPDGDSKRGKCWYLTLRIEGMSWFKYNLVGVIWLHDLWMSCVSSSHRMPRAQSVTCCPLELMPPSASGSGTSTISTLGECCFKWPFKCSVKKKKKVCDGFPLVLFSLWILLVSLRKSEACFYWLNSHEKIKAFQFISLSSASHFFIKTI